MSKRGRFAPFVFGFIAGALAMLLWLRTPPEANAAAAHGPPAPENPPPAAQRPPTPERERGKAERRAVVDTPAKRPTVKAAADERRNGALGVLGAMAPALGKCLPNSRGAVPVWLRVSAEGKVVAARFGREVSKDAAECARGLLVGVAIAEPGPVEEFLVELSVS